MSFLVPLIVLIPLAGAALALSTAARPRLQIVITVVTMTCSTFVGALILSIVHFGNKALVVFSSGFAAPFGIALVADRLSALLLVVTSVVLLAVLIFAIGQGLKDGDAETPVSIFYPTYLVLAAGVFNAFVAGDLFNLFVGFEVLLISSFVLITLRGTLLRLNAGMTYIAVSLISSIIFLIAIAFLFAATGTVNMVAISQRVKALPENIQLFLHLFLLIAFAVKAALFPLSFWLPDAYPSAPAPVTAVFAGLLTKVGIYSILRTESLLFAYNDISALLIVLAIGTMIFGILGAAAQAGIRRMLSFILISHIGYMLFGIALGTPAGWSSAIFYMVHHILIQTGLFLITGLIERHCGSASIISIYGLRYSSVLISFLFFISMLNISGVPPFSGFLGKLGIFLAGATLQTSIVPVYLVWAGLAAGVIANILTLYVMLRVWLLGFLRPKPEHAESWQAEDTGTQSIPIATARHLAEDPNLATITLPKAQNSRLMIFASILIVVASVALTVFAGLVYNITNAAGLDVWVPEVYIDIIKATTGMKNI